MKTLVLGASGATGKHVVNELLKLDQKVKVLVRPASNYPKEWESDKNVKIIKGKISEIEVNEMLEIIQDCTKVASCLGHNLSFQGIYGKPKKLVTDAVDLIYKASKKRKTKEALKFVLMNTAGNSNRDLVEKISFAEKLLVGLLRILLPPHKDNEDASDFLRKDVGKNNADMQWIVVRPDSLINLNETTAYALFESPTSSAIFKPRKTSRINVGNLIARLFTEGSLWKKWKGRMPVVYNS